MKCQTASAICTNYVRSSYLKEQPPPTAFARTLIIPYRFKPYLANTEPVYQLRYAPQEDHYVTVNRSNLLHTMIFQLDILYQFYLWVLKLPRQRYYLVGN